MAADSVWWKVWGPWTVVWWITAVALVAAALIVLLSWRRHRWLSGLWKEGPDAGITLYLDDDAIMGIYLQGNYKSALRREVEDRVKTKGDASFSAKVFGVGAGAKRSVDREVFKRYIEEEEPITVIGMMLSVLERAHGIVYADLVDQEIGAGTALTRAVGREVTGGDTVRLSQFNLRALVSVKGKFREVAKDDERTIFAGPFGNGEQANVTVACATKWLRRTVPVGTFQARCFGHVQSWDDGALRFDPIAVFQ
ncbi:hypothetical protein [Amycolatopsis pithecellobii]|uniref:Uncharacterized protein n=1 Tax=Amycolatopsis pithecellobii TaxID=664692 RepID=A0A6N7ZCC1_9PSEU|nr:hypothetical protein [Amycolatopsis pithecellobii]MTD59345.1 hypothetical protein [Amycolatopsis pithecellobii]